MENKDISLMEETMLLRMKYTDSVHRMSRSEAATIAGSDRTARNIIESLRKRGYRICSESGRSGYWIAKSDAEYKRFKKEYVSRAVNIFQTVRAMDAGSDLDQVRMQI